MIKEYYKAALKKIFDNFTRFWLIVLLIMLIIKIFIKNFFVDLGTVLLFGFILYRIFDKNSVRKEKWNNKYLKIRNKILKPFDIIIRNVKDWDSYVYRKCRHCKTILKLPLPDKRGFLSSKCPKCGKKRKLFTLRKVKIEIIKKGR